MNSDSKSEVVVPITLLLNPTTPVKEGTETTNAVYDPVTQTSDYNPRLSACMSWKYTFMNTGSPSEYILDPKYDDPCY